MRYEIELRDVESDGRVVTSFRSEEDYLSGEESLAMGILIARAMVALLSDPNGQIGETDVIFDLLEHLPFVDSGGEFRAFFQELAKVKARTGYRARFCDVVKLSVDEAKIQAAEAQERADMEEMARKNGIRGAE